ncbi:MAG: amino acid racemase [Caulobacteraceae bacterium]|nr:amino acid racemase [Caulobacteraceae bacterium]
MSEPVQRQRTIGVLGGMGPAATVDFLAKIIAATPAVRDQDHVPVIVRNVPQIPDRSEAILAGGDGPFRPMLEGLKVLEQAGAEVLAIPCNTAHHWHARLSRVCERPILHIAEAAAAKLAGRRGAPVGLMATRGTLASGLYQARLGALVLPDEEAQAAIDAAIAAVKAGRPGRAEAESAARRLLAGGARSLLLACTELPLAMAGGSLGGYCVDATLALAEACVAASRARPDPVPV